MAVMGLLEVSLDGYYYQLVSVCRPNGCTGNRFIGISVLSAINLYKPYISEN